MLTQERLKELLHYDPETGVLTWRVKQGRVSPGTVADSPRADGYYQVSVCGKKFMVHRLIWLYQTGHLPDFYIDHINGVKTDNRWSNLRSATAVTNSQNMRRSHVDNKHGYLGVSFIRGRKSKPFRSEIRHNGTQIRLGTFSTPEEAHAAYLEAKRKLHEGNTL